MIKNYINLIKEVNQWGELKCPKCGHYIIPRHPENDYKPTVIICTKCRKPLTLGDEGCQEANLILAELRKKFGQ